MVDKIKSASGVNNIVIPINAKDMWICLSFDFFNRAFHVKWKIAEMKINRINCIDIF